MATKLSVNVETGEALDVEMAGDELEAHERLMASLAASEAARLAAESAPTPAQRFDGVIDQAQTALSGAKSVAEVKTAFADALDGLRGIYGTGAR